VSTALVAIKDFMTDDLASPLRLEHLETLLLVYPSQSSPDT